MSLSELLVIIIVGVLLLRPEDFPEILRQLRKFQSFISSIKKEIFSHVNLEQEPIISKKNIDEVNFYLQKISNLQGGYEGEYSLEEIKKHYQYLIKQQIIKQKQQIIEKDQLKKDYLDTP
jgi:Sec-independent protein translocase protein TatA